MTAQSTTPTLEAKPRTITGRKVTQLRRDGQIPAVVYGHQKSCLNLSLDFRIFSKLYKEIGSTTLINLTVGKEAPVKVLVHDIQVHPVTRHIQHVDFYQVNLKEKLKTEIPLSFIGVADAVELLGGSLLTVRSEIEVECLPEALIQEIEVDISTLKSFEDSIRVKDLPAIPGITVLTDEEEMIASVNEPRSEEELQKLEAEVVDTTAEVASETGNDVKAEEGAEKEKESK